MPVVLENLGKRFGDGAPVLDDVNATIGVGRVRRPPRCVRLRQVHPAEHHGGTGGPDVGRPGSAQRRRRLHVPGRRPVPLADGAGEHRTGAEAARRGQGRAPGQGRRTAGPGAPGRGGGQAPARALRRHAPARGPGPFAGPGPAAAADGRAVRAPWTPSPATCSTTSWNASGRKPGAPSFSSPTTSARPSGWASACCCCPPGPAAWSRNGTSPRNTEPTPAWPDS